MFLDACGGLNEDSDTLPGDALELSALKAFGELAREQARRGYEVRVWAVRRGGPFQEALDDAEIRLAHYRQVIEASVIRAKKLFRDGSTLCGEVVG